MRYFLWSTLIYKAQDWHQRQQVNEMANIMNRNFTFLSSRDDFLRESFSFVNSSAIFWISHFNFSKSVTRFSSSFFSCIGASVWRALLVRCSFNVTKSLSLLWDSRSVIRNLSTSCSNLALSKFHVLKDVKSHPVTDLWCWVTSAHHPMLFLTLNSCSPNNQQTLSIKTKAKTKIARKVRL